MDEKLRAPRRHLFRIRYDNEVDVHLRILARVIAVLGGLGAAAAFATTTLAASRGARLVAPPSFLAGVMLVGLAVTLPVVVAQDRPDIGGTDAAWLVLSGTGNVAGLLVTYTALRIGQVGVVAPIVSTEGAIAAVIAVLAGEGIAAGSGVMLVAIACGILLAATGRVADEPVSDSRRIRAAALAVVAAVAFGTSLYATARVGASLSIAWAVLPARVIGVVAIALPLAIARELRIPRAAFPLVVLSGLCEVAGFTVFTLGARHGIAVSAVLASQFGAIAAVAAYFLFGERLTRVQVAGVTVIVIGVGVLTALQA